MKPLTQYHRNRRDFHITDRKGRFGLFFCPELADFSPYELIEIQSHNGREIAGKQIEPAEFPPSNNQWGTKGWTFKSATKAVEKMNQLAAQS